VNAQVLVLLLTVFVDLIVAVGIGCAALVCPVPGAGCPPFEQMVYSMA